MVRADHPEPVYVGRLGLTDRAGRRLLVDWRSPVAEPFFGATHANPMGLASRRRYRWTRGRSKGLEFDLVILVDPEAFGEGIEGAVDRYVAMTRATQQLVILTSS
jgi:DNA helicase IV